MCTVPGNLALNPWLQCHIAALSSGYCVVYGSPSQSSCQNGGVCLTENNSTACFCVGTWTGDNCTIQSIGGYKSFLPFSFLSSGLNWFYSVCSLYSMPLVCMFVRLLVWVLHWFQCPPAPIRQLWMYSFGSLHFSSAPAYSCTVAIHAHSYTQCTHSHTNYVN